MADRVFEDRVGLHVMRTFTLEDRLPRIARFGNGIIRDLFLPRDCSAQDVLRVRNAGLHAHLFVAVDGLTSTQLAQRTLKDLTRVGTRGVELNIELSDDAPLRAYVENVVRIIRAARPGLRMRINLAPWKAFALPIARLEKDGALYAAMQAYEGNMDNLLSPADVLHDMTSWGAPPHKLTVCYAAACTVYGSLSRQRALPDLSRLHRGVIFSDDLMADVGLL